MSGFDELPESWREAILAAIADAPPLPEAAIAILRATDCPAGADRPVAP